MNKEEKTIPLSAVELMADLQFVNLTDSTRLVAQCDLRDVRIKLLATDRLAEARQLLVDQMIASGKAGLRLNWVEKATRIIGEVTKELADDLGSEELRLVEKIAGLEQELEEHKRKVEERKKRREAKDETPMDTPEGENKDTEGENPPVY